ncbi:MAG: hypothetical protein U9P71_03885 [Campylobacterota bacterium]|nr:hypothetical protein [Campylobacterota bacterium]
METTKNELIQDIENLLNSYSDIPQSTINPEILKYMDNSSLKDIINDLLTQKENVNESNIEYLEQFKKHH